MFNTRGYMIMSLSDLETREMVHCNGKGEPDFFRIYFYTLEQDLAIIEIPGSFKEISDLATIAGRAWRERRNEIIRAGGRIIHQFPRLRDLPWYEREPFAAWLRGQTIPGMEGLPVSEQDFYYPWDYDTWKAGLPALD